MNTKISENEYLHRIHKVQDYIQTHLSEPITLDELSEVAAFSKYHFSRIFQAILQESVAHYVQRIRMEHALFLLAHRTDKAITDIALDLGFTDSAIFSRSFSNYYGLSPKVFRKQYSKNCKEFFHLSDYNKHQVKERKETNIEGEITIEEVEPQQIAYVRYTGTYKILAKKYSNLINSLFSEAEKQGCICTKDIYSSKIDNMVFAIYHDNPEFSEEEQFRTSLCISVPNNINFHETDILGKMILSGGKYAVGHFVIDKNQYGDAWDFMYTKWLTCSGFKPRNSDPFEVYKCIPTENNDLIAPDRTRNSRKHHVDIYVPIEPL